MKQPKMINDGRDQKLAGDRKAGRDRGTEMTDTKTCDRDDDNSEKSGRIQIPRHTSKADLLPEYQCDE